MNNAPNLEVRIDRLIVEGIDANPHHARRIHAALERELTALFRNEAMPARLSGGAIPAARAPELQPESGGSPGDVGCAIARSVYALISGRP